jgi:hypothetical protein
MSNSEPIPLFSPTTVRTLRIIAVAVVGFSLALNLWGWLSRGYHWTTLLGPIGMLLLIVSFAVVRTRGRLYLVLQLIGMGLLIADIILILRRR